MKNRKKNKWDNEVVKAPAQAVWRKKALKPLEGQLDLFGKKKKSSGK